MGAKSTIDVEAISAFDREHLDRLPAMSMREKGDLLIKACRSAAQIEASRIQMGLPPTQPAPWPESTWKYLRECARRVRAE